MVKAADEIHRPSRGATVVVLCRSWGGDGEAAWALRMVAGALATVADVTVYASQGPRFRRFIDGAFSVVELGTDSIERAESERLLAGLEYLAGRPTAGPWLEAIGTTPRRVAELVGDEALTHWSRAEGAIDRSRPDLVVVAGYQQVGAAELVASWWPGSPLIVLPLVPVGCSALVPSFAATFKEASLALVFTEEERRGVEAATDTPLARVSLPMTANPSVLRGPHEQVGDRQYLAVITGAPLLSRSNRASQAMLLVARFPDHGFAICASDALGVFSGGQSWVAEPAGRGTDLLRLMAWAGATIDLRPGPVFARHCLQSLVHGTPILAPSSSHGREHAQLGRCGLWFDGPAELIRATEALLAPSLQEALSRQGADYVAVRCRPTEGFVSDVFSELRRATGFFSAPLTPGGSVANLFSS